MQTMDGLGEGLTPNSNSSMGLGRGGTGAKAHPRAAPQRGAHQLSLLDDHLAARQLPARLKPAVPGLGRRGGGPGVGARAPAGRAPRLDTSQNHADCPQPETLYPTPTHTQTTNHTHTLTHTYTHTQHAHLSSTCSMASWPSPLKGGSALSTALTAS